MKWVVVLSRGTWSRSPQERNSKNVKIEGGHEKDLQIAPETFSPSQENVGPQARACVVLPRVRSLESETFRKCYQPRRETREISAL